MNGKALVQRIQKQFTKTPDLIIKDVSINKFKSAYVVFLETVSSSDKVHGFILRGLSNHLNDKALLKNIKDIMGSPNLVEVINIDQIEYYLISGFTIVFTNYNKIIYAVETKSELDRGIQKSELEQSLVGPKDSFTENYQKNLGLVKRRIKSSHLKVEDFTIGRLSKTQVGLLYIANIAEKHLVDLIKDKLDSIDIDVILDVTNLRPSLNENTSRRFPTMKLTEKPDYVAKELTEGKIAILCDNSPEALVLPAFFIDFINPVEDNYAQAKNISLIKIIRLICLILAIMTPAFYIAITNYNQESIPLELLVNFTIQRNGVPFPAIIEAFGMLLICEILRETDIRFPNAFGSSISIIGTLIIGEAAVSAGFVSPIMIIVIAITFVAGLMFTDAEIKNVIRFWSYIQLIFAATLGLYGIALGILFFFINICSINSFRIPYLFPIAPYEKAYFNKTVIKSEDESERSEFLTENITREKN